MAGVRRPCHYPHLPGGCISILHVAPKPLETWASWARLFASRRLRRQSPRVVPTRNAMRPLGGYCKWLVINAIKHKFRFFAVFSGIESVGFNAMPQPVCFNPEGIESFSPRLARLGEGLPWVGCRRRLNPEGVAYQRLGKHHSTLSGLRFLFRLPWVARSSQPRADGCNPVGIGKPTHHNPRTHWPFHRKQRRT